VRENCTFLNLSITNRFVLPWLVTKSGLVNAIAVIFRLTVLQMWTLKLYILPVKQNSMHDDLKMHIADFDHIGM